MSMYKVVMVAGYPKESTHARVSSLLDEDYCTTEFMYDGGFIAHLCYTGPRMSSEEAHRLTCEDGVYEATIGTDTIDLDAEVYEHISEEPLTVAGPHGDYTIVAELYGFNEDGTDRYEC